MKLIAPLLLLVLFMSGCAFTDAKLDIQYDGTLAKAGPLSELRPMKIQVEPLKDHRPFLDRIGDKRNGYGMDCADIVTLTPVPDIMRDGLIAVFEKNGHTITDQNPELVISGSIEHFWFDSQMNFWTVEFMGTADLNLELKDPVTQSVFFEKQYSGHANQKLFSGYHKEVQNVMEESLKILMDRISMDSQLVEALNSH